MSVSNLETIHQPHIVDWRDKAKKEGFEIPPQYEGIKIVDFVLYDVAELIKNQDKLQFDPRISGTDQKHIDSIARDISFRGFNGMPQYITKVARTGEMAPLRHHILKALEKLAWEKIPSFVVETEPYQDEKARWHQHEEILKDFTGDGAGALNDHAYARHLETEDRIRAVNDKAKYGEFGKTTNEKEYKKRVTNFVKDRWGHLDKSTKGKITEGHLKGVMPRKITRYDGPRMKEIFPEVPKDLLWDYDNNVLDVMCHDTALRISYGNWLMALKTGCVSARTKGKSEAEILKKLSEVKIRLWGYVKVGTGKDASGIFDARARALSLIRDVNISPAFQFSIQEVNWAPQILEPKRKRETAWTTYRWNKKTETF